MVRSLAKEQFDDLVKRVRIFAHPEIAGLASGCPGLEEMLLEAAQG